MTHQIQNFQSDVSASLQDDILHRARELDRLEKCGGSFDVMDAIAQDISHVAAAMAAEYEGRNDFEGGSAHKALIDLQHAAAGWEVDGPFEPMVTICIFASAAADGPAPVAYERLAQAEAKVNNRAKLARKAKAQSGEAAERRRKLIEIIGPDARGWKDVKRTAESDPTIEPRICELYGVTDFLSGMYNTSPAREKMRRDFTELRPPEITRLII